MRFVSVIAVVKKTPADGFPIPRIFTTFCGESLVQFHSASQHSAPFASSRHTMIDLQGSIPAFIAITEGKVHDVNALDWIVFEPGAFYVMDRAYVDFARLARVDGAGAFFVTRAKSNMSFYVRESRVVDKSTGLRADQIIRLNGQRTKKLYPRDLRRISYLDSKTGKTLVFLNNNFLIKAIIVSKIYKARWQIELFFKWLKQNLRIKAFYGTSENAVKTQIWIAVSTYLLVAILNKQLKPDQSMSRILQVLSVNAFSKDPIYQLLMINDTRDDEVYVHNQLMLNNFYLESSDCSHQIIDAVFGPRPGNPPGLGPFISTLITYHQRLAPTGQALRRKNPLRHSQLNTFPNTCPKTTKSIPKPALERRPHSPGNDGGGLIPGQGRGRAGSSQIDNLRLYTSS